jgi:RHS repeat-associated protein
MASEATSIKAITTTADSTAAIRSDGRVATWGHSSSQQLGHAQVSPNCAPIDTADHPTPRDVPGLANVIAIDGGMGHYLALKSDGTVWAWGGNGSGQLGDGTKTNSATPVRVGTLTDVTKISAGNAHGLAVKADGTVWAWGYNGDGRIGDGTSFNERLTPVQVVGLTNPVSVEASGDASFAVLADGSVWMWGYRPAGLIGSSNGYQVTPARIPSLSGIVSVTTGPQATFALGGDGRVWAWGSNVGGLLGDPSVTSRSTPGLVPGLPPIRSLNANGAHAIAIADDGSVWTWGTNTSGQAGDGTLLDRFTPMQVLGPETMTPQDIPSTGTFDPALDVVEYYHADATGTVRVITDANRNEIARYDYMPFGEEFTPAAFHDPKIFAAGQRDAESGHDYMGARYFEARLARFLRPDDHGFIDQGNPQTWNLYAYALNNPMRYVDPTGHFCEPPAGITTDYYECVNAPNPPQLPIIEFIDAGLLRFLSGGINTTRDFAQQTSQVVWDYVTAPRDQGCMNAFIGTGFAAGALYGSSGVVLGGVGATVTVPTAALGGGITGGVVGLTACMSGNGGGGGGDGYRDKSRGAQRREQRTLDSIAKKFNIDRRKFGDFIESYKDSQNIGHSREFSWKELEELAKLFQQSGGY